MKFTLPITKKEIEMKDYFTNKNLSDIRKISLQNFDMNLVKEKVNGVEKETTTIKPDFQTTEEVEALKIQIAIISIDGKPFKQSDWDDLPSKDGDYIRKQLQKLDPPASIDDIESQIENLENLKKEIKEKKN